ncbi:MAG: histidine phosphatase family protein [Gaiellaceae bacterium]
MLALPDQAQATRVVLVRHAETEESARGRCYGQLDVRLSPQGLRQAQALAGALADHPFTAVYTSPLARALDTARPIAAAQGIEPTVLEALAELDFGELEGLRYDEIEAQRPDLFRAWMDEPAGVRFPGGEGLADLRARVLPALAEIRARHEGQAVAVVAHGGVLRVALAEALGLEDGALFRLDQAEGGVSVVDWLDGVPLLRVANATLYSPA